MSSTSFGLSDDLQRELERELSNALLANLEQLGFEPIAPDALRNRLEKRRLWVDFDRMVGDREPLKARFESRVHDEPDADDELLRQLASADAFGADVVLFTELVYHSRARCDVDPRDHSKFAEVVDGDGQALEPPLTSGACVVTHIESKLVDAQRARTVWHNRLLRELRSDDLTRSDDLDNVEAAVRDVIAGPHGLGPFAPK